MDRRQFLAAGFAAHDIDRRPVCHTVQPGGQNGIRLQSGGVPRQVAENGLGHFLRELRRTHVPEGHRIYQVQMAMDQRGKRFFGAPTRVLA